MRRIRVGDHVARRRDDRPVTFGKGRNLMDRTHAQILAEVKRLNDRIRTQTAKLGELLTARRDLYREARERPDPVGFRHLAEAAGTTEGAVMQVTKKAQSS